MKNNLFKNYKYNIDNIKKKIDIYFCDIIYSDMDLFDLLNNISYIYDFNDLEIINTFSKCISEYIYGNIKISDNEILFGKYRYVFKDYLSAKNFPFFKCTGRRKNVILMTPKDIINLYMDLYAINEYIYKEKKKRFKYYDDLMIEDEILGEIVNFYRIKFKNENKFI